SKFASNHSGKVMAMYATPTGTNSEYDINLVTSTDNGVSWSSPLLVETTRIYGFQDAAYLGRWGQVAYGGNDTWIAGWTKSEPINQVNNGSFLEVIVSRNGGQTWTAPARVVQS